MGKSLDILLRFLPHRSQLTLQIQPQLLFQRRCLVARLPGSESQLLELAQAFISEVSGLPPKKPTGLSGVFLKYITQCYNHKYKLPLE